MPQRLQSSAACWHVRGPRGAATWSTGRLSRSGGLAECGAAPSSLSACTSPRASAAARPALPWPDCQRLVHLEPPHVEPVRGPGHEEVRDAVAGLVRELAGTLVVGLEPAHPVPQDECIVLAQALDVAHFEAPLFTGAQGEVDGHQLALEDVSIQDAGPALGPGGGGVADAVVEKDGARAQEVAPPHAPPRAGSSGSGLGLQPLGDGERDHGQAGAGHGSELGGGEGHEREEGGGGEGEDGSGVQDPPAATAPTSQGESQARRGAASIGGGTARCTS